MSTKLYVGNLDYSATGDQLRELFTQAGAVTDATVITDRYSGRSKGFGFVEMSNDEEAQKAIEMFNGKDFQGRDMIVNEARPRRTEGFQPREVSRPAPRSVRSSAPDPVPDPAPKPEPEPTAESVAEPAVEEKSEPVAEPPAKDKRAKK